MPSIYKLKTERDLKQTPNPYLRSDHAVWKIYWGRTALLSLVGAGSVAAFGFDVLFVIGTALLSVVLLYWVGASFLGRKPYAAFGEALFYGLLFALLLPAGTPSWIVLLGVVLFHFFRIGHFGSDTETTIHPVILTILFLQAFFSPFLSEHSALTLLAERASAQAGGTHPLLALVSFKGNILGGSSALIVLAAGLILAKKHWARIEAAAGFAAILFLGSFFGDLGLQLPTLGSAFFFIFFVWSDAAYLPLAREGRFFSGIAGAALFFIFHFWFSFYVSMLMSVAVASFLAPVFDEAVFRRIVTVRDRL